MDVIKHSESDKLFFYNENDSLDIETAKVDSIFKRKLNFLKKKIVYLLSFFKIKRNNRDLDYIKLCLIKYIHKNKNIFSYSIYKTETIIDSDLFMSISYDPPYITNIEVTCSKKETLKLLNKFRKYLRTDELKINILNLNSLNCSHKNAVFIKIGNPGIYFSMGIYMRLIINIK